MFLALTGYRLKGVDVLYVLFALYEQPLMRWLTHGP